MDNKKEDLFLLKNIEGTGSSKSINRLIMHEKNVNENLPFIIVEKNKKNE